MEKKTNTCGSILIPYTSPHGIIPLLFFFLLLSSPSLTSAQRSSDSNDDTTLNSNNISPSMALIVLVLVLVFFITGAISVYIQCAGNSTVGTRIVAPSRRGNAARGLDRSVIDSFPTFVYSAVKEVKIGKGSLECAVCLCEFEDNDNLRLLPKCDHVFHSDCIDAWLAGHTTCPVCRANLVLDSSELKSRESEAETPLENEVRVVIDESDSTVEGGVVVPKRKLPRSHSTGHSLIRGDQEDVDKFTLRLPADVRRQLIAKTKLKRATSLVALPRALSSRRGYRGGEGSGSSRYGRILASFGMRVGSFRSTVRVVDDGDVTGIGTASTSSKRVAVVPLEKLPPLPV